MKMGKIGKSLTAALVGGALLWPTSSAEKPSSYNDYHPMPGIVYAAETAAPKAYPKDIPNQTGGQYLYATRGPKLHYKELPRGVDPAMVKVFDDKDLYHYVDSVDDWSRRHDIGVSKGMWIQGDVMDVIRSAIPDAKSWKQLDGATLVPGKEYFFVISNWIEDKASRGRMTGEKLYVDGQIFGGSGKFYQDATDNFIQITRVDSGGVIKPLDAVDSFNIGSSKRGWKDFAGNIWEGGKPYAGYESHMEIDYKAPGTSFSAPLWYLAYTSDRIIYWVFDPTGFPPGDYRAEINTAQGKRTVNFKIEGSKPDPRIALDLRMNYDFLAQGEAIPWYMINPNSLHAYKDTPSGKERKTFDLSGVVKFDLEGSLPKNVEQINLKVYVTKPGWMYTDDTKILETTVTGNQHEVSIDTNRFPNGKHDLVFRFGQIPGGAHSNPIEVPVIIQNQPLVASQPPE